MVKKREEVPAAFRMPPDIFWIRPDGKVFSIIGHGTDIKAKPERYGLHSAPETDAELDEAFMALWSAGWLRGRWSLTDQQVDFHLLRPQAGVPLGNAYDFVVKYAAFIDRVNVAFADPFWFRAGRDFSREEFLAQKFPTAWGYNPGRRR
jgi:hypothetical protein